MLTLNMKDLCYICPILQEASAAGLWNPFIRMAHGAAHSLVEAYFSSTSPPLPKVSIICHNQKAFFCCSWLTVMGQTGKFSLFYLCIQDHLFPMHLHAGTYTVIWRIHYSRPLNETHNCAVFSARHQRAPPLCRRKCSCLDHCFSAIAAHFFLDMQHFLSSDK